ncbi:hypothetical protein N7470_007477 [Penicillium chermesinum]|nr:hypothetical protein N7470_007477 [Penicillium chermesinum]
MAKSVCFGLKVVLAKGKTMMAISLVDHLWWLRTECSLPNRPLVSYFFCRNSDTELNSITAILKGLIFQLVVQDDTLMRVLRSRWNTAEREFQFDTTSWRKLWDILWDMLDRCTSSKVYLVVDALDECEDNAIGAFLQLIVRNGLDQPRRIKWLLTSRPLDAAERELLPGHDQAQVSLELNYDNVAQSVRQYVVQKVHELDRRQSYWRVPATAN